VSVAALFPQWNSLRNMPQKMGESADTVSFSHCTCKREQMSAGYIIFWASRVSAMLYVLFGLLTFPQVMVCRLP